MSDKLDRRMKQCGDCLQKKKLGKALEDSGFVCLDCLHKRAEMATAFAHQVEKTKSKIKRLEKKLRVTLEREDNLRDRISEAYRKENDPPKQYTWSLEVLAFLYKWTHTNEQKECGCPMEIIDIMKSRGF